MSTPGRRANCARRRRRFENGSSQGQNLDCVICAGSQMLFAPNHRGFVCVFCAEFLHSGALMVELHKVFEKLNGSRTCLVQTLGRAGTNRGRDAGRAGPERGGSDPPESAGLLQAPLEAQGSTPHWHPQHRKVNLSEVVSRSRRGHVVRGWLDRCRARSFTGAQPEFRGRVPPRIPVFSCLRLEAGRAGPGGGGGHAPEPPGLLQVEGRDHCRHPTLETGHPVLPSSHWSFE